MDLYFFCFIYFLIIICLLIKLCLCASCKNGGGTKQHWPNFHLFQRKPQPRTQVPGMRTMTTLTVCLFPFNSWTNINHKSSVWQGDDLHCVFDSGYEETRRGGGKSSEREGRQRWELMASWIVIYLNHQRGDVISGGKRRGHRKDEFGKGLILNI